MGRGKSATAKAADKARNNTSNRASDIALVQINDMRGTEKQIKYAKDIINEPIEKIKLHISYLEKMKEKYDIYKVDYNKRVPGLLRAAAEYREAALKYPQFKNAAYVIENKHVFSMAMKAAISKAFKGTDQSSTIARNVGL